MEISIQPNVGSFGRPMARSTPFLRHDAADIKQEKRGDSGTGNLAHKESCTYQRCASGEKVKVQPPLWIAGQRLANQRVPQILQRTGISQ